MTEDVICNPTAELSAKLRSSNATAYDTVAPMSMQRISVGIGSWRKRLGDLIEHSLKLMAAQRWWAGCVVLVFLAPTGCKSGMTETLLMTVTSPKKTFRADLVYIHSHIDPAAQQKASAVLVVNEENSGPFL